MPKTRRCSRWCRFRVRGLRWTPLAARCSKPRSSSRARPAVKVLSDRSGKIERNSPVVNTAWLCRSGFPDRHLCVNRPHAGLLSRTHPRPCRVSVRNKRRRPAAIGLTHRHVQQFPDGSEWQRIPFRSCFQTGSGVTLSWRLITHSLNSAAVCGNGIRPAMSGLTF